MMENNAHFICLKGSEENTLLGAYCASITLLFTSCYDSSYETKQQHYSNYNFILLTINRLSLDNVTFRIKYRYTYIGIYIFILINKYSLKFYFKTRGPFFKSLDLMVMDKKAQFYYIIISEKNLWQQNLPHHFFQLIPLCTPYKGLHLL